MTQKSNVQLTLPFESFFMDKLRIDRPLTLLISGLAEWIVLFLLFHSGDIPTATVLSKYGNLLTCSVLAINVSVYFVFDVIKTVRTKIIEGIVCLSDESSLESTNSILEKNLYNERRLLFFALTSILLGELTFGVLGVDISSHFTRVIIYCLLLPIVFFLCGVVVGVAIGVWLSVHEIGNLPLDVNIFHPDGHGGTKFLGDVSIRVTILGSVLVLLYSVGAHLSPYINRDLTFVAYLWVVAAAILFIVSLVWPTYSIHKILSKTKENYLSSIFSLLNDNLGSIHGTLVKVYERQNVPITSNTIFCLMAFFRVNHMPLWPYSNLPIKAIVVIVLQGAALAARFIVKLDHL